MRVEEAIGQRVRARRDELGMTQEEFGRDLGPYLGKPWSRQTVSMAEQGTRAWVAADLLAAALVLHTTVGDLLRPPVEEAAMELGGPYTVPKDALYGAIRTRPREDLNLAEIQRAIDLLADIAVRSQKDSAAELKVVRDLDTLIMHRIAAGGVFRSPHYDSGLSPTPLQPGQDDGSPAAESHDDQGT